MLFYKNWENLAWLIIIKATEEWEEQEHVKEKIPLSHFSKAHHGK